jgi:two-component system, LytTR family, response regulator
MNANPQNFVSNQFVLQGVKICMGWFPQIDSRPRGMGMMIPEIRTIIADDEPVQRERLRYLLAAEPGVEVVAECADVLETIAAVKTHKPNLLWLDIQMIGADGFQDLKNVVATDMPVVIFTSTDHQRVVKAFELRALDYLLKPVGAEQIHAAVEKTRAELLRGSDREFTHRILNLLSGATPQAETDRRLMVKTNGRMILVELDQISWIEAAGNYVRIRVGSESYMLREGIGRIAQRLDSRHFVRIHRSMIVNVRRIKELQPCNGGEYMVVLKDGKQLSCSRGYRANLQEMIAASLVQSRNLAR